MRIFFLLGVFLTLSLIALWCHVFFSVPVDAMQGEAFRIMYLHVPSAVSAFFSALLMAVGAGYALAKKSEPMLLWQRAAAEVGLLFTAVTLLTGSLWGRPIWGTYWTWDARLTTTLLLAILFFGWIFLFLSTPAGQGRTRVCSLLSLLIFIDVPIIYKSVTWWRTLHQPYSVFRSEGSTMDPSMRTPLIALGIVMMSYCVWLIFLRWNILTLVRDAEAQSYALLDGPQNHTKKRD